MKRKGTPMWQDLDAKIEGRQEAGNRGMDG